LLGVLGRCHPVDLTPAACSVDPSNGPPYFVTKKGRGHGKLPTFNTWSRVPSNKLIVAHLVIP
jgi:hypothetical protein